MLFPRSHQRLQDRIVPHGDRFDFDHRQRRVGAAAVAGKFRHRVAAVGVLILSDAHAGQQFAFNNDLGAGDGFLRDADALHQLHRALTQRAGHAQFVIAKRRGGGFEAGANIDGRIETHIDGYRQRFSGCLGFLAKHFDMAAGGKKHRQLIPALHAQAVDGDVGERGVVRIAGQRQAQAEEGAGVDRGVGRRREQGAQIKVRIVGQKDLLLTGGAVGRDHYRRDRCFHRFTHLQRQLRSFAAQQQRCPLAAGVHAHQNARMRIALNIVKHHRRANAGGALHGAAGADMAIDAGQLGVRVHRMIGFEVLIVMLLQQRDGVAQILNRCGHDVLLSVSMRTVCFAG